MVQKLMKTLTSPTTSLMLSLADNARAVKGTRIVLDGHTEGVSGVSFHPKLQQLATCSFDKTVRLWDWPARKQLQVLEGHTDLVLAVGYAPDGLHLASGSADKTVRIWDLPAGKQARSLAHPNIVDALAYKPQGDQLATGCHDGIVRLWDPAKGAIAKEIKAHTTANLTAIYAVAWSKDGKQIASAGLDKTIKLWDVASAKMIREFKAHTPKTFEKGHTEGVYGIALSPDGKLLASVGSDKSLKIWNIADGNVMHECVDPALTRPNPPKDVLTLPLAHPGWIYAVRFTPDGRRIATGAAAPNRHGSFAVWNASDGKLQASLDLATGPIHALDISPDGLLAALACGPHGRDSQTSSAYVLDLPRAEPAKTKA